MQPRHVCHKLALLIIFFLTLSASALAQTIRGDVSVSFQKATLKEVLAEISRQSGLLFVYNPQQIDDRVRLDIRVRRKQATDVVSQISEMLGFTFVKVEKQIVLKPSKVEVTTETVESARMLTVTGYIRDSTTHEVLIGATVSVEGRSIGTATNGYGYYSLPLKRGEYTLIYSFLGYRREYVKINLTGDAKVDRMLVNTETYHEAISISGEDHQAGAKESLNRSSSSVNVRDFQKYSGLVLGGDLVGILATDHGITRLSDGSAFYSVRGGGKDQNLVLIDEAPIYHPSHLFGFYSSVSSDAINNIEVFTSDFPLKYGGRLSSITDIRTKDGSLGKLKFSGELTPFTASALLEAPINKDKITATINYRKSMLSLISKWLDLDGHNSFYDINSKVHVKISDRNRLYLSFYGSNDYYEDLGNSSDYSVAWNNIATTVRDYHILSKKLFMNNSVYMGRYKYKIFANDEHTNYWSTSIVNFSAKNDFVFNMSTNNTIRFGCEYTYHFFTPARLYVDNEKSGSGLLTGNADNIVGYVGAETKVLDNLAVKYGARLNFWDNYGAAKSYYYNTQTMLWDTTSYPKGRFNTFIRVEPRFSVVYKPLSNTSLKVSFERNVQFLHTLSNSISPFTTLDLWIPSGNYFKPQTVNSFDFSAMVDLREISLTFCTYYKYAQNLTEYKLHANMLMNSTIESEFYLGQSNTYGFEVAAEKHTGRLHLKAFYAYSHSRRLTPDLYSEKYISDENIPHTIHLMAGYNVTKNFTVKADWNFNTGIPYTKPVGFYYYENYKIPYYGERNNARLPNYHKMNIAMVYHFNKKIFNKIDHSLTLSVLNIYNRTNFVMVSYNRISTPSGDYVIPSNIVKDNSYQATGLSLPGIVPMISWKIRVE